MRNRLKDSIKKELQGKSPIKRMGQNFLTNISIIKKIVKYSNIEKKDIVLEVGPGTGILTEELLKTGCKVLAVEKDSNLCKVLKEKFKDYKNLEIIEGDILKIDKSIFPKNYKIVANIPYYITSILIRSFLESSNQPKAIVLTIQKEVAQRICSTPPNMSILSLSVQYYAKPKKIIKVPKKNFWPIPKVDSAVLEIIPFKKYSKKESDSFFKVVKAGFSSPRKQITNNLSSLLNIEKKSIIETLKKNNIDPSQRPEELTIENWESLKDLALPN